LPKCSNSEIETRSFGQANLVSAVSVTGLFGIGHFGQTMKSRRNLTC